MKSLARRLTSSYYFHCPTFAHKQNESQTLLIYSNRILFLSKRRIYKEYEMATSSAEEADPVTYEELADIEREFDDLDVEISEYQFIAECFISDANNILQFASSIS